jgi:hypothetical protein
MARGLHTHGRDPRWCAAKQGKHGWQRWWRQRRRRVIFFLLLPSRSLWQGILRADGWCSPVEKGWMWAAPASRRQGEREGEKEERGKGGVMAEGGRRGRGSMPKSDHRIGAGFCLEPSGEGEEREVGGAAIIAFLKERDREEIW